MQMSCDVEEAESRGHMELHVAHRDLRHILL